MRRSIIFQFRIDILPLHIETGRSRNVKKDERKCHICNNDDIENEFHFLCVCNAYVEFRNVLYNPIYNVYHMFYDKRDQDKVVYFMKCYWKGVSVYLEKKTREKRTNILNKQT